MKAVVFRKYGSLDNLQLEEVDKPEPKDDEVLIKLHATSVNSADWEMVRGSPIYIRMWGLFRPRYNIMGGDIAGTIEAAGNAITDFKPGDEVFADVSGNCWGGFAEYVCVPTEQLVLKSPKMTFEQAAAIPQAGVLALQGLRYNGGIQEGERVLVNGAGGGAGSFAIQLAKMFGAEVTGVDSGDKLDIMRSAGADHVIDYRKEDFAGAGQQYDLVLDCVLNRPSSQCIRSLAPGGAYCVIGGTMPYLLQLGFFGSWFARVKGRRMGVLAHKPNSKDLEVLRELFDEGKIRTFIDGAYTLPETKEAMRRVAEGTVLGKVVVTIPG